MTYHEDHEDSLMMRHEMRQDLREGFPRSHHASLVLQGRDTPRLARTRVLMSRLPIGPHEIFFATMVEGSRPWPC